MSRTARHLAGRILAAVLLVVLSLVGAAQPAAAHAELVSSTPSDGAALAETPSVVELRFDEPVTVVDGAIRLLTDGAEPVPLSATVTDATVVATLPELATDSAYAVAYRVVSADGHPVGGVVTFTVGDAAPGGPPSVDGTTPGATELLVRVLTGLVYLGLLVFGGLVFCARFVLRPTGGAVGRSVSGSAGGADGASARFDGAGARVTVSSPAGDADRRSASGLDLSLVLAERWALVVASVASVLLVPASALRVLGESPSAVFTPRVWLSGVSGPVVLAAALVVVLGWVAHLLGGGVSPRAGSAAWRDGARVTLAAAAVLTPTLVGHTLTHNPPVMVFADAGHLLGGAFWVGGLLAMLLFLHDRPGKDLVRAALHRFSRWALWAVVLIAASGVTMAVTVLGSAEALVNTGYGRLLLLKVMVVAAVVVLAGWLRFRRLPSSGSRPKFFRALRHEATLLVAVVLLTGFLTNTSPSHSHDHGPQQVRVESQGLAVEGTVAPGVVGVNTLVVELTVDGAPVPGDDVEVSFRLPAQDLGPIPAEVQQRTDGTWAATANLPSAGVWEAQVAVRVSKFERPIAVLDVTIS